MTGVVLEGGGARGAYHAGAIKALYARGIKLDGFVGTSIGSINACFCAANDHHKMYKLWNRVNSKMILDIDDSIINQIKEKKISKKLVKEAVTKAGKIIKNSGIDTSKLKEFLNDNINEERLMKSDMDFGLVTFNVSDLKPMEIYKEQIKKGKVVEYLIASSYLPVFKTEKIIDNKYYVDGGIYNNLPIDMLEKKGYDRIYAVRTYGPGILKKKTLKKENVIYINPSKDLGSILFFDHERIKKNIKMGYYDTLKVLDELDGYDYYFHSKSKFYFDRITRNISLYDKRKLMIDFKTKNNKIIVLKVLEKLAKEYNINIYNIYNIPMFILKLKLRIAEDHKYYKFIKNLKVKVFHI